MMDIKATAKSETLSRKDHQGDLKTKPSRTRNSVLQTDCRLPCKHSAERRFARCSPLICNLKMESSCLKVDDMDAYSGHELPPFHCIVTSNQRKMGFMAILFIYKNSSRLDSLAGGPSWCSLLVLSLVPKLLSARFRCKVVRISGHFSADLFRRATDFGIENRSGQKKKLVIDTNAK